MSRGKPITDNRPLVFWGRMLLLSLLVIGFLCSANGMAVAILLLGKGIDSISWFLFFSALTVGFYGISGYLGRAMYQRVRAYRRSGASTRSKKRGLVFAISFSCLLVFLTGTIWVQGISRLYENIMEQRYGGKWCAVCGEYAVVHRTSLFESTAIVMDSRGRIVTEGWWYKCRACGSVFRVRGGRLVKTEDDQLPFLEDMDFGQGVGVTLRFREDDGCIEIESSRDVAEGE